MPVEQISRDEFIQLHTLLVRIRHAMEQKLGVLLTCKEYDAMGVAPSRVDLKKWEHRRAVFLLAKGLAEGLGDGDEFGSSAKLAGQLGTIARRTAWGVRVP